MVTLEQRQNITGLHGRQEGFTPVDQILVDAAYNRDDPIDQGHQMKQWHDAHVGRRDSYAEEARGHEAIADATLLAEERVKGIGSRAAKNALTEVRRGANSDAARASRYSVEFEDRRNNTIKAANQHLQENFGAYEDAAISDLAEQGRSTSYGQDFTPPQSEQ